MRCDFSSHIFFSGEGMGVYWLSMIHLKRSRVVISVAIFFQVKTRVSTDYERLILNVPELSHPNT